MSLTAPAPAPQAAAPAHASAARPRAPHAASTGQPGTSPFAQLLQGAADEEGASAGADAAAEAPDEPSGNEAQDTGTHRAEPKHHAARDAADGDAAATPPQPQDAPAPELNAALRRAGLLAAARTKATVGTADAAGRRGGAGLESIADGRADGKAHGLAQLAVRDAQALGAGNPPDFAGLQSMLGAMPANLAANADAAQAGAAAHADFSLASLGPAGGAPTPPPEATPAQATLAPAPGSAAFPAALGAQLNTWLKDGVQYATLELNPQDMGPIDVRIALQGGRTEVQLGADVAATREALAEALPQLAEALGDVGLSLAGGSVSDQTGQHARQGEAEGQRAFALPGWLAPAREGAQTAAAAARPAQRGLIDLVA
ncbi:flagellar hook-length control protein FliK [Ideonella sp.]|uniref:flagellar hook-length control protein FliK n=1 Tax=Ideonella sp. TaxID=1929293 RepID=UPI002B468491|nr:flagellar hook-length control protein FliK [Ideonella sp.]HJV67950.1 flagellar hook-length control protein FliK [Ideonella sp.]